MTDGSILLNDTRQIIREIGIRPSRRLGQHFVVSSALLDRMVEEADLGSRDTVLEIGGGTGSLTERLVRRNPKEVIVIEKDKRLAGVLRGKFSKDPRVHIAEGDYLKLAMPPYDKCVSNPPFSISSRIILKLIDEAPSAVIITFQRDYARRLLSREGEREYGRISVILGLSYSVQDLGAFPSSAFFPPPSTEISLLKMILRQERISRVEAQVLQRVTGELFRYRRKRVAKAIRMSSLPRTLLDDPRVAPLLDSRVFELQPSDLLFMARLVSESSDDSQGYRPGRA